ncbi:MAG: RDD family protein [Chitinophagales bacterium]|nr:RDD family protein [Chitinophagales bacterium]
MSVVQIPTNFNIELEFELADFGKRILAYLIDFAICTLYVIFIIKILDNSRFENGYDEWGLWMVLYFPVVVYDLVFETLMNGQSPGKKILKLRVVRQDGGRPSFTQFATRWLLRFIDFTCSLGMAGTLSVALTKLNQRLGDTAAGTIVISTKYQPDIDETLFMEVADSYVPKFPMVMQLTDRDINTIKRVLDRSWKDNNADLLFRTYEKVIQRLNVQTNMRPRDFLETLLKDYNYLSAK